jgi:hypothetical protein
MDDIDFINSEINNFINLNLALLIDSELLSGTGVAPHIYGIDSKCTAFSVVGTSHANKYRLPNVYDLIRVIKAIIGKDTLFIPNYVLLNSDDFAGLEVGTKDQYGRYNIPPFVSQSGQIVSGIQIIDCGSAIAQNTMRVGDFNFANIYTQGGTVLEFGYTGTDFTDGLVTLYGYERLCLLIKLIHEGAFINVPDIEAAVASITIETA